MNSILYKKTLHHSPNSFIKDCGIYITSIGHYRHMSDDIPFYRDYYPGYQIFYSVSGTGWLDYKGGYQTIEAGTITCINLERRHGIGASKDQIWEHYWIVCNGRLFDYLYNLIFSVTSILKPSEPKKVHSVFKTLFDAKTNNDLYFDIRLLSSLLNILSEFLPAGFSYNPQDYTNTGFIDKAVAYIQQNFHRKLSIQELADESGYSLYHFSRLFKGHTGYTPNDFIIKTRIEKAKSLLANMSYPLELVAQKCGFNSENYLIKIFKAWEGVTPGSYRKNRIF